jgi:hypothetical protein
MARVPQEHIATEPRYQEASEMGSLVRPLMPWAKASVEAQARRKREQRDRKKKGPGSHTRRGTPVG